MAKQDIVGGTDGAVVASGFNGDIDAWSMAIEVDEVNWRTFANKWKKRRNVAYSGSGRFTGTIQFDDSNTKPMPASTGGGINEASFEGVSLTLTATTGCTYTGKANITGININRPSNDRMTGEWSFVWDGQPNETWDEGA